MRTTTVSISLILALTLIAIGCGGGAGGGAGGGGAGALGAPSPSPSSLLGRSLRGGVSGIPGGGKGFAGWADRIGSIASRQIGAARRPLNPPMSWFCFGLRMITLAEYCGV